MINFTPEPIKIYLKLNLYLTLILAGVLLPLFSQAQFVRKGDAVKISDKCFKITEDRLNRYGSIWWQNKIDLREPFELNFILYLGTKNDSGADGISFLFHNDPRGFNATGAVAGGLGYGVAAEFPNTPPIVPSVAIEFDTYDNNNDEYNQGFDYGDIPADHSTVVYNGQVSQPQFPPVWLNPTNPDVENNQCQSYRISWNPATQELKLYFNDQLRFNHTGDIINEVFGGQSSVYYGFTGSTGGLSNEQTICLLDPESKPEAQNDVATTLPGQPVTIAITQNDSHTDGEPIALSRVANNPQNGRVTIVGQNIIYTPNVGFIGTDTFTYEACEASSSKCYSKCASATVTVTVACQTLPEATVTASGSTALCPGEQVTLTARPGYTYLWNNGATTQAITVNQPGDYAVTLKSADGCTATSATTTVSITEVKAPLIRSSGTNTLCPGGSITLLAFTAENEPASDQNGFTFRWSNGHTGPSLTVTEPGSYTVKQITPTGCEATSAATVINPRPVLAAPVITAGSPTTFCSGGQVVLTVAQQNEANYQWFRNGIAAGSNSASFTANEAGTYTITISNSCQEINSPQAVNVVVNTPPQTFAIQKVSAGNACSGATVKLSVPEEAGITYKWFRNGQELDNQGYTFTATESGSYTITATNACGTTSVTEQVQITAPGNLAPPVVSNGSRCGSGSITLSASGGQNGEYRWYSSATATTPLPGQTNSNFATPSISINTNYYVSIARNGCESERVPVTATLLDLPEVKVSAAVTINAGEATILEATGAETYRWQPLTGLNNPNIASPTARPTETTTYTVTGTNAAGCAVQAQVIVTVKQDLMIPTAISPNGDGVNDTWEITNIQQFPQARLEIFNRWGNKIYDVTGYRNNWNGTWQGSLLPVGTYFYVITLDKNRKLTGPISIVQ